MNTISSLGQAMAMDGLNAYNVQVSQMKQNSVDAASQKTVVPSGSEVAENIVQNAADVKADAQQLQKMSDLISGRKLQFNVNNELGSIIVKVVDPNTNQVVKEIPSEDMQKLKINIRKTIGALFDQLI
ncbi:MAG: flagellar protein FlaG [Treponema sp.]|nr:flagellar protein FlaG [Treponema sp.]